MSQCLCLTKQDNQCKNKPKQYSNFCAKHQNCTKMVCDHPLNLPNPENFTINLEKNIAYDLNNIADVMKRYHSSYIMVNKEARPLVDPQGKQFIYFTDDLTNIINNLNAILNEFIPKKFTSAAAAKELFNAGAGLIKDNELVLWIEWEGNQSYDVRSTIYNLKAGDLEIIGGLLRKYNIPIEQ